MSFCRISACLLVVLGVVFVSARPYQFISENLKRIHESISDELRLKQPEIGSAPLFSFIIRSLNSSCQSPKRSDDIQLMKATLDVYFRILSHASGLLEGLPDSEQSNQHVNLNTLQEKMRKLKQHLNDLNHDREEAFNKLKEIKVNDPMVQKKALAEFLEVYQAASVIGHCNS